MVGASGTENGLAIAGDYLSAAVWHRRGHRPAGPHHGFLYSIGFVAWLVGRRSSRSRCANTVVHHGGRPRSAGCASARSRGGLTSPRWRSPSSTFWRRWRARVVSLPVGHQLQGRPATGDRDRGRHHDRRTVLVAEMQDHLAARSRRAPLATGVAVTTVWYS
ncbi:hypothetical protein QJS66_06825 [Kocuria rhizophila]|nr:hypothetical protein QJS66_06825 [Kocuria rhizophila]